VPARPSRLSPVEPARPSPLSPAQPSQLSSAEPAQPSQPSPVQPARPTHLSPPVGPGHVPESFAERYDFAAPTWKDVPSDGARLDASVRRNEPQVRHVDAGAIYQNELEVGRTAPERAQTHAPEAALLAEVCNPVTPSHTPSRGLPLLIAVLAILAGGGYYAYRHWPSPAYLTATTATVAPKTDEVAAPSPPVTPAPSPPAEAAVAPSPSGDQTAAASIPASATSAEPPAPATAAAQPDNATVPAKAARAANARRTSKSGAPASVDESRSAIETNRVIERSLGISPASRAGSASTPEARDAAETNRLIARELGSSGVDANPGARARN
jgi:hypothetical protein